MDKKSDIEEILEEIRRERHRQDLKWGHQIAHIKSFVESWPIASLPPSDAVKDAEQELREAGQESFMLTLLEEVIEVRDTLADESIGDISAREKVAEAEIVQVAAVCAKWLQAIRERRRLAMAESRNDQTRTE